MSRKSITNASMHQNSPRDPITSDRAMLEMYQAFMVGYVRRINEATFNVTIGGVRIGSAKQTRLAQINLRSRIITFSRYALENVPERGRRYLVLHELAHVQEASHNKIFWQHVERFEPNYREISRSLEQAFKRNIKLERQKKQAGSAEDPVSMQPDDRRLLVHSRLINPNTSIQRSPDFDFQDDGEADDSFICLEDEFSLWDEVLPGTIHGGSEMLDLEAEHSDGF